MLCKKHHTANCAKASLLLRKLALVIVCGCLNLFFTRAQATQLIDNAYEAQIYYRLNASSIEPGYLGNAAVLQHIDSLFTPRNGWVISCISITGHSSPEGSLAVNRRLARQRGETLYKYIASRYPDYADRMQWVEPEDPVEAPRSQYPYLRSGHITVYYRPAAMQLAMASYPKLQLLPRPGDTLAVITVKDSTAAPVIFPEEPVETVAVKNTVVAAKTNLLFDAATALNFEVEVPIADRFSIMAEDVFPWWETGNKYCFQMWEVGVEARYWFKPWERTGTEKLRGWFAGVYGMSSMYDFQYDRSLNYQGEYWSAGVTGGYVMPIGRRKRVNLEFSLGLGYLHTQYRHYMPTVNYDKLIRDRYHDGKASYWGPTKAKISLVIPLNFNTKAKEVRHD